MTHGGEEALARRVLALLERLQARGVGGRDAFMAAGHAARAALRRDSALSDEGLAEAALAALLRRDRGGSDCRRHMLRGC